MRATIHVWGARGTFPAPGPHTVRYGGHTSCVEVRAPDGTRLILDAGTGLRALGAALGLPAVAVSGAPASHEPPAPALIGLVLTHRHTDHVQGLSHFSPLLSGSHAIHLWCADDARTAVEPFVRSLLSPPFLPPIRSAGSSLTVHPWPLAGIVHWGDLRVHRMPAQHPGDAAILRIDDAQGPLLGYAPDNELATSAKRDANAVAWRAQLVSFLRDVPLLLHDAMYTTAELTMYEGWGHSSAAEAAALAHDCGAKRLLLFHHHPDRRDDEVERMGREAGAEAAREGAVYEIGPAT